MLTHIAAAAGPTLNTTGIVEWVVKNIIPILLLVIGIGIIASARKGKMSQNAATVANVVLGCIVIAAAAAIFAFAGGIAHLALG